jgi:hypothetical protein
MIESKNKMKKNKKMKIILNYKLLKICYTYIRVDVSTIITN